MQSIRTATLISTLAAALLGASVASAQVPVRPPASDRLRPAQPPSPNQVSPAPRQQPRAQTRQQPQQRGQSGGSSSPPRVTPADEGAAAERSNQRAASQRRGRFQLDFNKADIADVIQTISDFTGKLFIVPDNIRGKITIVGPEDGTGLVTAEEAYAAFLAGLEANNWTVYPVGRYLKLVEKRAAAQSNTWTYVDPDAVIPDDERMITKVVRLNYVTTDAVANPLKQLMSKDASVIPMPPDTMIITEVALNLRRIERILAALDQPGGGDELRLIQIEYATASEIAEKLLQIFETDSGRQGAARGARTVSPRSAPATAPATPEGGSAGGDEQGAPSITRVIPDERTNKLIVVANRKAFDQIENLIRQLDIPTGDSGRINVYYLENASAEELASTLQTLVSSSAQAQPGRAPSRRGQAAAQAAAAASAAEFSGEVRISADKATNSLVVMASAEDYKNLTKVIEKLDIPRRQVFVEAVIMEVNLSDTDELGFSWHGGAGVETANGVAPIVLGSQTGQASSLNLSSLISMGGFLAGMQGPPISAAAELGVALPSFGVVMHAMTRNSNVNVLSTPHILTADNEEAEITVGQNVPFQAGFAPSGISNLINQGTGSTIGGGLLGTAGLGSLFAPIQRQNVELRLKIKPQINESDFIRMEVEEQTEEIAENDPVLGPTTAKRTAKTVVVAQDQTTVVLGGLIQERTIRSVQKTPVLGDIPVVGRFFRDTSTQKTKTNLLLFLTPYIIRDQSDFRRIFERKMREREEFLAAFYGTSTQYEVPIDFARKAGPIATLTRDVSNELLKVENGGPGAPGETTIVPGRNQQAPPVEEEWPDSFDERYEPELEGEGTHEGSGAEGELSPEPGAGTEGEPAPEPQE